MIDWSHVRVIPVKELRVPHQRVWLAVTFAVFAAFMSATAAGQDGAEKTPLSNSRASIYIPGFSDATQPLALERGPQLFIDDLLVAESDNLIREVCPPARNVAIPNPVVTGKEDGNFQPYMTVLRDTTTGRFRINISLSARWHSIVILRG